MLGTNYLRLAALPNRVFLFVKALLVVGGRAPYALYQLFPRLAALRAEMEEALLFPEEALFWPIPPAFCPLSEALAMIVIIAPFALKNRSLLVS